MLNDVVRAILEGVSPRDMFLEGPTGPRWVRTDLEDLKSWILVGYQSELVLTADLAARTILIVDPTPDTDTTAERAALVQKLAGDFEGEPNRGRTRYGNMEDLLRAMNSLGRAPQPSDFPPAWSA